MEAAMMNLGVVLPEPGYLEAVREITQRHGIVLIFDEVKTGLCIAAGGATERYGVCPTWSRWPRRSAAACPPARSAARGGHGVVEDGTVYQVGTYNGNPLGWPRHARTCSRSSPPRPTPTSTGSTTASSNTLSRRHNSTTTTRIARR